MGDSKLSYLDLVETCDNFPYDDDSLFNTLYKLFLPHDTRPHGYMLPTAVHRMPWTPDFTIDHENQTVTLTDSTNGKDPSTACNTAFATVVNAAIDQDTFTCIHGQHSEFYRVVGAKYPVQIERFAADLFGIISRGAHLTVCTHVDGQMRIWVPRRGKHMFTYPNKLDTTVAGGVPAHQSPFENVIQEADEEASLPEDLIKRDVRAAGVLTYIEFSSEAAGGDERLVQPNTVFVYDLEVGKGVKPVPKDGEVQDFYLMSVEEVKDALLRGEFKTNSAVVMIDFFVRHGILTEENERDYVEIVARMHRRLPFPTSGSDR